MSETTRLETSKAYMKGIIVRITKIRKKVDWTHSCKKRRKTLTKLIQMTGIERTKETTISPNRNGRALKFCRTKSFWERK